MMTLAQDMGMDKLKMECEDHVISTMKGKITKIISFNFYTPFETNYLSTIRNI